MSNRLEDDPYDNDDRLKRPFRVGLRNSLFAIGAIGLSGLAYLLRFSQRLELIAWWAWAAVAAGAVGICFAHAYAAALVGQRKANRILGLALLGCLIALVLWLVYAAADGRR